MRRDRRTATVPAQFLNWAIDNNGAYDYAADTRGYSLGAIIEYAEPRWAPRVGALLMPTVANGINYDFNIAHARGENVELEFHDCILELPGMVKLLAFENYANMAATPEAIAEFRTGIVDTPDVTLTRVPGRTKCGFGLNVQQQLSTDIRSFSRLGWSDGANESLRGRRWSRPNDQIGLAVVTNGLSTLHRTYLELGGKGFLLGDGMLRYGPEDIAEAYYTAQLRRACSPQSTFSSSRTPATTVNVGRSSCSRRLRVEPHH